MIFFKINVLDVFFSKGSVQLWEHKVKTCMEHFQTFVKSYLLDNRSHQHVLMFSYECFTQTRVGVFLGKFSCGSLTLTCVGSLEG